MAEGRAGAGHRDLLADDRADGELETVGRARQSRARRGAHEPAQRRVAAERLVDRLGIGVEIEEASHRLHDGRQLRHVVAHPDHAQRHDRFDRVGLGLDDDRVSGR